MSIRHSDSKFFEENKRAFFKAHDEDKSRPELVSPFVPEILNFYNVVRCARFVELFEFFQKPSSTLCHIAIPASFSLKSIILLSRLENFENPEHVEKQKLDLCQGTEVTSGDCKTDAADYSDD